MFDPPKRTVESMSTMDNLTEIAAMINDLAAFIYDLHDAGDTSVLSIDIDVNYDREAVHQIAVDTNVLVMHPLPGMRETKEESDTAYEVAMHIHGVKINTWVMKGSE